MERKSQVVNGMLDFSGGPPFSHRRAATPARSVRTNIRGGGANRARRRALGEGGETGTWPVTSSLGRCSGQQLHLVAAATPVGDSRAGLGPRMGKHSSLAADCAIAINVFQPI